MTASNTMAKRAAAGTLALAVCLTGGLVSAGAANAAPGFAFSRIQGETRIETAVAASVQAFPTGTAAGGIVLVNKDRTVDGLTASYAAGVKNAPILYTDLGSVPAATLAEMTRLGTKNVTIVGGTAVVAASVETSLKAAGYTVERFGGEDRYDTAAKVAVIGGAAVSKVFVASGERFADALVVGPIAYAKKYPILLTRTNDVPAPTTIALNTLQETSRLVVGGTTVVPEANYTSVAGTQRLSGPDRQATAVDVAKYAIASEGFKSTDVAIAGNLDTNAADALAAAPFAGKNGIPLLFAEATASTATNTYLLSSAATLTGKGYVLGGPAAVSDATVTAATTAATGQTTTGNQSFALSPADAVALTLVSESGATATADDRVYTVVGLDNALKYRVTLVNAANVTVSSAGAVSFVQDGTTGLAAPGDLASDITVVNGVPTGADTAGAANVTTAPGDVQSVGGISPSNGSVSFRVDGQADESLIPVLYVDGGANTRLEIGANGQPTEKFGVGGAINFQPTQADQGSIAANQAITEVEKTANQIVAGGKVYNFDANDTFYIEASGATDNDNADPSEQVTFDQFKAELSVGDNLEGDSYQTNPALSSTFLLEDLAPVAPTATIGARTSTSVSFTLTGLASGATAKVYAGADNGDAFSRTTDTLRGESATDQDATTPGFQITASGLTANTQYDFFFTQTTGGEESAVSDRVDSGTTAVTAPASPFTTAASLSSNEATTDNVLDADENLVFGFDSAVTVAAGDTIRLIDTQGDEVTLTNGANATFAVSGGQSTVLTVDITGAPVAEVVRGDGVINTDATNVSVLSSTVGNTVGDWNVARSSDRSVVGVDTALPVALTGTAVNANPGTEVFALGAGAGQTEGDIVTVYNAAGVAIGTGTEDSTAGLVITTSGFTAGETLYVTYRDDNLTTVTSAPSQGLAYSVAPYITAGVITAGAGAGFGNNAGDSLAVTFSSAPTLVATLNGAGAVSESEAEALLGVGNVFTNATFTAAVDGNTVTLTTVLADGATPVAVGASLPGTANTTLADVDGTTQVVAVNPVNAS